MRLVLASITAWLVLSIASPGVRASVLPSHAFVGTMTNPAVLTLEGSGPLDTGLQTGGFPGQFGNNAQARTDISADRFLQAYSSAFSTGAGLFDPRGNGQGRAAWRDIAFVTGSAPPALRLNFVLDGELRAVSFGGGFPSNWAELGIETTTNPIDFFTGTFVPRDSFPLEATVYFGNQQQGSPGLPPGFEGFVARGSFGSSWDSVNFVGDQFTGRFHIVTPFNPALGGYGWGVSLSAWSFGRGGSAEADALSTLRLESVTLPDGTPIRVTFDSGLRFGVQQAIPEPATLALFGIGSVALLGWGRRKRWRNDSPAAVTERRG